jgi:dipeptidyl aminopeptidase/acylaminoacyl peptidase
MKPFRRLRNFLFALTIVSMLALVSFSYSIKATSPATNSFTLEQVLSSPFPSELIASNDGSKIAWVFDAQGSRNVWIAEAPAFKGRALTGYNRDDGQEITEITFSPDGKWLAYVRGGEENSDNEIPNPTSDVNGARREIYIVNTRLGGTTKIAEGSSPMFSPKSDRVIFSYDGHLYSAPVAGNGLRNGAKSGSSQSYNLSAHEMEILVGEIMPPPQVQALASNPEQKKDFIKQLKEVLSVAQYAEQNGYADKPEVQTQLALQTDLVLQDSYSKKNPSVKVEDEEINKYLTDHPNGFEQLINSNPQLKAQAQGPQAEGIKKEFAQIKVLAARARQEKMDQEEATKLKVMVSRSFTLRSAYLKELSENGYLVTDADIEKYYKDHPEEFEEVRVRHILISTSPEPEPPQPKANKGKTKSEPKALTKGEAKKKAQSLLKRIRKGEAKKKAQSLLERIRKGENFAKLAEKNSDDPGSKVKGGDLGYFPKGIMVPEFDNVAFSLKPGELSDVFESQFGYHIIKVEGHRTKPMSDEAVKKQVSDKLKQAKLEEEIKKISDNSKVQIAEDFNITPKPMEPQPQMQLPTPDSGSIALADTNNVEKMFEIRGSVDSPAWSPDGTQLAFSSMRGDHSFIALYKDQKFYGKGTIPESIRFLEPSLDRDIEPRWSPDGKQIAYIRLFNIVDTFSKDTERITPWAIRIVDVATGKGREIWKSGTTHMDSFSRLPMGENQFQWAGDKIIFASEQDGWSHLYAISTNGGEAVKLTAGDYEVENVVFSPDRSYVIVAANADDIDRRHLWKINLADGKPEAITKGAGIEMYPVIVDGGKRIACLRSTARDPFMPVIANADGSNIKQVAPDALPKDFPSAHLVEPEQVIVRAADGMNIHCQLFKAKNATGKTPAVVFMHGGPMRQMLLGWHYGYYYHNSYALNQYLASRGYTVISVNYRAGIGYGRAFREAKHRGQRGASEYQDVVAAGKYLQSRSDVDTRRIGLWGGSYGGFLTAMGLAHNSDIFAAGVDIHGVHDWTARVGRSPWATGNADALRVGRESSPLYAVEKWKSPVLLIHGDDDRNVAFSQSVELAKKLRERGIEFEQLVFPDDVHDFLRHENWLRVYHATTDFFDRKLK